MIRPFLLAALFVSGATLALAQDGTVILTNGLQVPLGDVKPNGADLEMTKEAAGLIVGQKIPAAAIDVINVSRPAAFVQAMAKILDGAPAEAPGIVEPIRAQYEPFVAFRGNLWHEAMRIKLIAFGVAGDKGALDTTISMVMRQKPGLEETATIELAHALAETAKKSEERLNQLKAFIGDNRTPTTNAIAQYFIAETLAGNKKDEEALEAYLRVPSIMPVCDPVVLAASQIRAAQRIQRLGPDYKKEAAQLYRWAVRAVPGTTFGTTAESSLKDLQ